MTIIWGPYRSTEQLLCEREVMQDNRARERELELVRRARAFSLALCVGPMRTIPGITRFYQELNKR